MVHILVTLSFSFYSSSSLFSFCSSSFSFLVVQLFILLPSLSLAFYLVPVHVSFDDDDDEKKKSGMNEQSEPETEEKKRMKRTRFGGRKKSLLLCWSNKTCSESVCVLKEESVEEFPPSLSPSLDQRREKEKEKKRRMRMERRSVKV